MEPIGDTPRLATNLTRGCIVATLPADFDPAVLAELRTQVLDQVHQTRVRGIILDCASVEIMDGHDFEGLLGFIAMAGLMGARVVLAGIRPGVASALADLDADLPRVRGALTLDDAFILLRPEPNGAAAASAGIMGESE